MLWFIGFGVFNWVVIWFSDDGCYMLEEIGDFVWCMIWDVVLKECWYDVWIEYG